ncbi:MAG: alpha/beta fold hydrolase [Pseudomonadales bacterium]
MSKVTIAVFATLILLLGACGSDPTPAGPQTLAPSVTIIDIDDSRQRQLEITFWQPATITQPAPLLVFAHGLGGQPDKALWLTEYLASHGYIVAAVKFPNTNGDDMDALDLNDLLNQPGDITRVIDIALGVSPGLPTSLVGKVDAERIALAGHSFGGLTTYLAGFDRELREPRLQAAILLSAGAGDFLYSEFYQTRQLPMLLLHGDQDLLVDYASTSAAAFDRADSPRVLVKMIGGSHLGFIDFPFFGINPDSIPCLMAKDSLSPNDDITFHADLMKREPATGVGDYTAPLPCEYEVPNDPIMSVARQHQLSKPLILNFLSYALADQPSNNATNYRETLKKMAEKDDLTIKMAL